MYEQMLDNLVIVHLKEPDHSGRTSFSARLIDYTDNRLEFENKSGIVWIIDESSIAKVTLLKPFTSGR